jgi:hypothetical protein
VTSGSRLALQPLFLLALAAPLPGQTPPRCPEPQAREFDFWLGEWDVENRQRNPQASLGDTTLYATGSATDEVHPVLGGCAIVEHWFGELTHTTQRGFSVRAWEPERERWVLWLVWPGPAGVAFGRLEGTFANGRGEFRSERTGPRGPITTRFRFSDIEPDAFTWSGAFAPAGGDWTRFWVMDFTRRREGGPLGPFNGMDGGLDACPEPEARAFDFLVGSWRSEDDTVELKARTILDGCALSQEESRFAGGETRLRYAVRARETAAGAWAMVAIDDEDRGFSRWTADAGGDLRLLDEAGLRRVRYEDVGADTFTRVEEASRDGGATWAIVERTVFVRSPA